MQKKSFQGILLIYANAINNMIIKSTGILKEKVALGCKSQSHYVYTLKRSSVFDSDETIRN